MAVSLDIVNAFNFFPWHHSSCLSDKDVPDYIRRTCLGGLSLWYSWDSSLRFLSFVVRWHVCEVTDYVQCSAGLGGWPCDISNMTRYCVWGFRWTAPRCVMLTIPSWSLKVLFLRRPWCVPNWTLLEPFKSLTVSVGMIEVVMFMASGSWRFLLGGNKEAMVLMRFILKYLGLLLNSRGTTSASSSRGLWCFG